MKVLLVSGFPILPAHEGNRSRILALSRAIRAQGHSLWIALLPAGLSEPNDHEAHLSEFGPDRVSVLSPPSAAPFQKRLVYFLRKAFHRSVRRAARALRLQRGYRHGLDELYYREWNTELRQLHSLIGFDAVVVEYVFHSAALTAFPDDVLKIIDTHDAFGDRHRRFADQGIPDGYWLSLCPKDETLGFRRANAVLAIQDDEAATYCQQLGTDANNPTVSVVNHFLDLSVRPVCGHTAQRALFLGSANPANIEAINGFIANTLPLILKSCPDFRLVIAGLVCSVVPDLPAVIKLGQVRNVMDAFEAAPMLINPMGAGTGINIKILDAIAAGVPVITTQTGARGLADQYCKGILRVKDRDSAAFASSVIALLSDEPLRRIMGQRARESAELWNEKQIFALRTALSIRPLS